MPQVVQGEGPPIRAGCPDPGAGKPRKAPYALCRREIWPGDFGRPGCPPTGFRRPLGDSATTPGTGARRATCTGSTP